MELFQTSSVIFCFYLLILGIAVFYSDFKNKRFKIGELLWIILKIDLILLVGLLKI